MGHTSEPAFDLPHPDWKFKGVKSYPRGVTTNSDSGIESYETYYPVFEAMEQVDMVLNLHGEIPSDHSKVSIFTYTQYTCISKMLQPIEYLCAECRARIHSTPQIASCQIP